MFLHGRRVRTVFELLGTKENDATYSVGWGLCQCPRFQTRLLDTLFGTSRRWDVRFISLQERRLGDGITDIELLGNDLHVIVEAKRGWTLPSRAQLERYARRLEHANERHRAMVVLSECTADYAAQFLPKRLRGVEVKHLRWRDAQGLCRSSGGTHAEKRLMSELANYFESALQAQRHGSNLVYVVSLKAGAESWSRLGWREFVTTRRRYFHPDARGWPRQPPNYMAFRYDGRLQSIHHIEHAEKVPDMHTRIREVRAGRIKDHFLYTLGPPITPSKTVRTGNLYRASRVWAELDLLLTCDTIAEAVRRTRDRPEH